MFAHTAVIGTGFLGQAVVSHLCQEGDHPCHTFRRNRVFADSIRFDLLRESLAGVIPLDEVRVIVVTAKVEDMAETMDLQASMKRLFLECRDLRVVYISSDAVFDGGKGLYCETDLPWPRTQYGRNKRMCEEMLKAFVENYCIIRPSYIYGYSCGQLDFRLSHARRTLQEGKPLRRFVDMYKSPIEVNQFARVIAKTARSAFRGVLHAGGGRVSVYDFFQRSLSALGDDTAPLIPERMPSNSPADYLVDTSLDSRLLMRMFGENPVSIEAAFAGRSNPAV